MFMDKTSRWLASNGLYGTVRGLNLRVSPLNITVPLPYGRLSENSLTHRFVITNVQDIGI